MSSELLLLLDAPYNNNPVPPPIDIFRITEDAKDRILENGNIRILE